LRSISIALQVLQNSVKNRERIHFVFTQSIKVSIMPLRSGLYLFDKAIQGIRQGIYVNFITVGTITISLLTLSAFLIVFLNLNNLLDRWREDVHVTIYLDDSILSEDILKVRKKIADFKEVELVRYISKEDAIHILKKVLQTSDDLFEGLTTNPLPASMEVQLKKGYLNLDSVEDFIAKIKGFKEIEEVKYDQYWIKGFSAFLNVFGIVSLTVETGLLLAAIFIISNTIGLSIYARREEVEIMRLVGATNLFIKAPFFIEGLLQGLLGGLLSIGLLYTIYSIFISKVYTSLILYLRGLDPSFLSLDIVIWVIIGGMLVGIFGSMISIGRFLRI